MAQIRANRARFRNCQADNAQAILKLVLKRKAELAAEEEADAAERVRRLLDLDDDSDDNLNL
jgi:hypothetical protein